MPFSTFLIAVLVSFISTAVFFALNGLFLKLISSWLEFSDDDWKTAYKVALYAGLVSFGLSMIPAFFSAFFLTTGRIAALVINVLFAAVNAVVFIWFIRKYYDETWGRAALAWLIIFVINIIVGFILGLVIGVLATAFAFTATQFV